MVKQATQEAVVLILVAVGLALVVYAVRPDKIGIIPAAVNVDSGQQSSSENEFSEISIEEAVRLMEFKDPRLKFYESSVAPETGPKVFKIQAGCRFLAQHYCRYGSAVMP
ncbi:MAG: hypothetical protein KFF68_03680 [Desulfosarcina sp.]|nr:hypothetical protein [Desulfosarcina sp.]